ncbi:MAG TPA: DUF4412 domain-containing protein [Thermoanaerobaculia bacterium]|nr:DUF4412 domain-containing protein [Thermoanaerobaculia bacterium]
MRCRRTVIGFALFAAFLAAAAPAAAGVHYQAETTTAPAQGKPQVTRVEAWVDGPNAKVVFRESDQPTFSAGQYLLTQDGGKTLFLVDPEERTITEFDLEAMLGMVGGVMEGMQGIMNLEFSDVSVEKLGEGSGGELLGYPVTHSKYRTTYTTSIKVLGMKRGSSTETLQEVWSTDAFGDPALGVWLRTEPPATGMKELDELIAAEMEKVEGFPLKTVSVSTTTGQKGKRESSTRTETVVTRIEETSVPAGTFELPVGYTRTEMMPQQ